MFKQNLSTYEKALVMVVLAIISIVLEGIFIYQYLTTGIVTFSPTAMISGDAAFYFLIITGVIAGGFLPYAVNQFRIALARRVFGYSLKAIGQPTLVRNTPGDAPDIFQHLFACAYIGIANIYAERPGLMRATARIMTRTAYRL